MFFLFLGLKIIFFCLLAIIVRGSVSRYRIDQLVTLNWKVAIYAYIFFLFLYIYVVFFFNFL